MKNVAILIIFAILALVALVNLYNVLGRKVGFRSEDKALGAQKPNEIESGGKLERPVEARNPSLEALKTRDVNFNEINFLEKARETYEQVVLAFHRGELEPVKDRLSEKVYKSFSDVVATRTETPIQTLSFVEPPKADIDTIEYKDEQAQLRVRFLSELVYETPAGENGETTPKLYRRAAEYWTFQRAYKNMTGSWILARVEAAKA